MGALDFDNKLHKIFYNQGYVKCYNSYNVDAEVSHALVTSLLFKANRFSWDGDTCGILNIPSDQWDSNANEVHKLLLDSDGEF